jgi:hypothetical protein
MDNIHLHHNDEQIGPFTEEKIRRYLDEGRIEPTTLAWVEGAADWKPISEMLGLPTAAQVQAPPPPIQAAPVPAPQQQAPAYSAPQAAPQNPQSDPKKLIIASWLMIGVTCLIALIPGVGFLTWIVGAPILLVTFILGILTLNKGKTLQGVSILLVSLIAAPIFLVVAPIITTAGAVAAAESGSSSSGSYSDPSDPSDSGDSDLSSGSSPSSGEIVAGDLKKHLVGFWRSVKKNDLDDTYLYQTFSETEYYSSLEWLPYKVVGIDGNVLTFAYTYDTGTLGEFNQKSKIVFLSEDRMRIEWDRLSEGYVYERISEEQWVREQQELDEAAIQELRQKMQRLINE